MKSVKLTLRYLLLLAPIVAIQACGPSSRIPHEPRTTDPSYMEYLFASGEDSLAASLHERSADALIRDKYLPLADLLGRIPYQRIYADNSVQVILDGADKFTMLLRDIESARDYIHLEYYRFTDDEFGYQIRNALIRKAAEGVEVRLIIDRIANPSVPVSFYRMMEDYGAEIYVYHGLRHPGETLQRLNNLDHRKIVIIDGAVAYTGGMNLARHYFSEWRDTHVRLTGPVIAALQGIFLDHWLYFGCSLTHPLDWYFRPLREDAFTDATASNVPAQAVATGREWKHAGRILQKSYEWCLDNADTYFYMQNPYFAPPVDLLRALTDAARRGVDVRIMLPEFSDIKMLEWINQSYYRDLLEAGVRLFHRHDPFMHTKFFVTDDYITSIGTANTDARSLALNYENNMYFYDENLAVWNRDTFLKEEEEHCVEVFLSDIESWSAGQKALRKMFRAIAPQM